MKACFIAKHPLTASRELDGEMIIMSAVDSTLFTLNEVASLIWKHADGVTSLQEIVESKVCADFDVEPIVAFADAECFVAELAEHGVLVVADQPIGLPAAPSLGSKR